MIGLLILVGQAGFNYQSPDQKLTVKSEQGSAEQIGDSKYKLILTSERALVKISAVNQGIEMMGRKIDCVAQSEPKSRKSMIIQQARISGKAYMLRKMPEGWTAIVTSNVANFRSTNGIGTVDIKGALHIDQQSPKDKRQMTLNGSNGWVSFSMNPAKGQNGLLAGIIDGPVDMYLVQAPSKSDESPTNVTAHGRQLILEARNSPTTLTVLGVTRVTGLLGDGTAQLNGTQKLVITLDRDGRATKLALMEEKR